VDADARIQTQQADVATGSGSSFCFPAAADAATMAAEMVSVTTAACGS